MIRMKTPRGWYVVVVVGKPRREATGLLGAGKRVYVALDGPFVCLEDSTSP